MRRRNERLDHKIVPVALDVLDGHFGGIIKNNGTHGTSFPPAGAGIKIKAIRLLIYELQLSLNSKTPQIISGTKVINNINNVTAVVLFALSELQSAFKAPNAKRDCFACSITNGDELASSNHFDGTTWKGEELMALFSAQENGAARFNYIIAYNPNPDDAI